MQHCRTSLESTTCDSVMRIINVCFSAEQKDEEYVFNGVKWDESCFLCTSWIATFIQIHCTDEILAQKLRNYLSNLLQRRMIQNPPCHNIRFDSEYSDFDLYIKLLYWLFQPTIDIFHALETQKMTLSDEYNARMNNTTAMVLQRYSICTLKYREYRFPPTLLAWQ